MWLICKSQRRKERLAPAPIWEGRVWYEGKGNRRNSRSGRKERARDTESPERPGQGFSVARFCFID